MHMIWHDLEIMKSNMLVSQKQIAPFIFGYSSKVIEYHFTSVYMTKTTLSGVAVNGHEV